MLAYYEEILFTEKSRYDSRGNEHVNYNISLPPYVVRALGLDTPDREKRALYVDYDFTTKTITIKKIV